jgi:hypothetical protein
MIDWSGVLRNGLWIVGLAVALAGVSYADWWRRQQVPRMGLGQALEVPWFRAAVSLGLALFCAGLALSGGPWWVVALWSGLGLLFGGQAVAAVMAARREGDDADSRSS